MAAAADQKTMLIDMLMGEPIPMEMMVDDLSTVRIVYVGEIHTIFRHHRIQKEILGKLVERNLKPALGLEMFGVKHQPILDRWQRGRADFAHLMRDLGHEKWANIRDYESLIMYARKLKIPLLGLNAPDKLVRKLARKGVEGLTQSERRKLPDGFDRINPLNDRLLRLRLRVHRAFKDESLDRIVLAQALRDATMARAVADFLDSPKGRDRIMMVVAGSGHVNYGFGIPERVRNRNDLAFRIVLPTESGELVLSEEEKRQSIPVHISHGDLMFIRTPIADYLHVAPMKEEQVSAPDTAAHSSD